MGLICLVDFFVMFVCLTFWIGFVWVISLFTVGSFVDLYL